MTYNEAHQAVRAATLDDTGMRAVMVPGSVRAISIPDEITAPEIPHVVLDSYMQDAFRFQRCRHDDKIQFTLDGWRAFVAAVKAGEFDGLLP